MLSFYDGFLDNTSFFGCLSAGHGSSVGFKHVDKLPRYFTCLVVLNNLNMVVVTKGHPFKYFTLGIFDGKLGLF